MKICLCGDGEYGRADCLCIDAFEDTSEPVAFADAVPRLSNEQIEQITADWNQNMVGMKYDHYLIRVGRDHLWETVVKPLREELETVKTDRDEAAMWFEIRDAELLFVEDVRDQYKQERDAARAQVEALVKTLLQVRPFAGAALAPVIDAAIAAVRNNEKDNN